MQDPVQTRQRSGVRHCDVLPGDQPLFDVAAPDGCVYCRDFITVPEEVQLVNDVGRLAFAPFEMRGVIAKRRVAFFGRAYDAAGAASPAIPDFLMPLRQRVAAWVGVSASDFAMALVNEYAAGAPIGWHRDAPQYEIVAGISLLSSCRMKFRPYVAPHIQRTTIGRRTTTHEIVLEPRSAYLLAGESRRQYEHHIPAVTSLRYSITFRTLRA
jgi:hypothetical protein